MPNDRRVGALDHPERFGSKRLAVYTNSNGPYFMLDGVRESVHGSQLWTSLSNVKMRGTVPVHAPGGGLAHDEADAHEPEDADLQAAIAASLAAQEETREEAAPMAPPPEADQDDAAVESSSNGARECSICLTEPVDTLMRPCNHLIACSACARRLARAPCPVCRRPVRSVERVFF